MERNDFFGTESIGRILLKIAPPAISAQLIQALYNYEWRRALVPHSRADEIPR